MLTILGAVADVGLVGWVGGAGEATREESEDDGPCAEKREGVEEQVAEHGNEGGRGEDYGPHHGCQGVTDPVASCNYQYPGPDEEGCDERPEEQERQIRYGLGAAANGIPTMVTASTTQSTKHTGSETNP